MTYYKSKPLEKADESGFYFAQEMLSGDPTAGINFDRLQYHPKLGYIIFEYLLCEEIQPHVTPHTSHPKFYWHKNKKKFLNLWKVAKHLNAKLCLVNYAKKGTIHEDKIKIIYVKDMDEEGIKSEKCTNMNRKEFQSKFRQLNKECL